MAFGEGNLDSTAPRAEKQDDLAHLLYNDSRPQNQIAQAAQDDSPTLIYTHRPPLRDNGPPVSSSGQNGDGTATYGPSGIYPGHGAPYSQYPMAPSAPAAPTGDMPRVTINPSPQMGSPGSGRIADNSSDISYQRNSSDSSGFHFGKWVDVAAQIGGGWYVRTHKLEEAKKGIDLLTPKTETKVVSSSKEYGTTGRQYHSMLEQRYTDVEAAVKQLATDRKVSLSDAIKSDAAADAYKATLDPEQSHQFDVYRQFKAESTKVKASWEAIEDLKSFKDPPLVKPTIPVTPDAPPGVFGSGAQNPWAIKVDSSPSIVANDFSKASEGLAADLAVAAREEGVALKAVNGQNFRKLLFGYGADFALEHTLLSGSSPGLITWGADIGAAFLTTKPWGVAKTVGAMVGLHVLGRIGDSITHKAVE